MINRWTFGTHILGDSLYQPEVPQTTGAFQLEQSEIRAETYHHIQNQFEIQ
jgi:hypothetical protein